MMPEAGPQNNVSARRWKGPVRAYPAAETGGRRTLQSARRQHRLSAGS